MWRGWLLLSGHPPDARVCFVYPCATPVNGLLLVLLGFDGFFKDISRATTALMTMLRIIVICETVIVTACAVAYIGARVAPSPLLPPSRLTCACV